MGVQAPQPHPRHAAGADHGPIGGAVEHPESKLRVHPAGTDGLVGVWLDPRRETQQNVSRRVQPGGQRLEQIELMVIVDHKASNASTQRILNFIRRLVVSMEVEVLGRHAGAERGVQLST